MRLTAIICRNSIKASEMAMKRITAFIAAVTVCLALASCGGKKTGGGSPSAQSNSNSAVIMFDEPVTVIDDDNCLVEIIGYNPEPVIDCIELLANVENRFEHELFFDIHAAVVNGLQLGSAGFDDKYIKAGEKKRSEEIHLFRNEIPDAETGDFAGDKITDIELTVRAYDNDDTLDRDAISVGKEYLVSAGTRRIYPYGDDKAVKYVRQARSTDTVLFNNEYVRVILIDSVKHGDRLDVYYFILNKTESPVTVNFYDLMINGKKTAATDAEATLAGKCRFATLSLSDSELEDSGIKAENVQNIACSLNVLEYDFRDYKLTGITSENAKNLGTGNVEIPVE